MFVRIAILSAVCALASCKPPPTDEDILRALPEGSPVFASDPLPSPDIEGAVWAPSATKGRILYGKAGEPPLVALACLEGTSVLRLTRMSPADEGAQALAAIIGNGHIGRIEVDATKVNDQIVWQGDLDANSLKWEPLAGPRELTLTVPGAGLVKLNASGMPGNVIDNCRNGSTAGSLAAGALD